MYRKDYLQRQLETMGKVMATLLGLRKNKDIEEHKKEMFSAFTAYTQFKPEQIEALSQEDFVKTLGTETNLNSSQWRILADLMYEKLQLYIDIEEEIKAKNLGLKCLYLYSLLHEQLLHNEFDLEVHYRLDFLKKMKSS